MAVSQTILKGLDALQGKCNEVDPCERDDQFHVDAQAAAEGLANLLVNCPNLGAPDADVIALSDFLLEMAAYHECMAEGQVTTGCQWNPAYLSSSGSPYDEILSLVTTLKFRQKNGLAVDSVALQSDLGWTEAQFEHWSTKLIDGGNISVTQDGSKFLLHLDNLDGVCGT